MVEHCLHTAGVAGSNPAPPTKTEALERRFKGFFVVLSVATFQPQRHDPEGVDRVHGTAMVRAGASCETVTTNDASHAPKNGRSGNWGNTSGHTPPSTVTTTNKLEPGPATPPMRDGHDLDSTGRLGTE